MAEHILHHQNIHTIANKPRLYFPLKWTKGKEPQPRWPKDPSISEVRGIAWRCLKHLIYDTDLGEAFAKISVNFLARKGTHEVYTIEHPRLKKDYVFKVTIPVDPCLLTESEVATSEFVRTCTDIPTPPVIAWNSSMENELGFEWILIEKVDGVCLEDVYRKVSWEAKLRLAEQLAYYDSQLSKQRFKEIGSLYFKAACPYVCDHQHSSLRWNLTRADSSAVHQPYQSPLCVSSSNPHNTRFSLNDPKEAFFLGPVSDNFFGRSSQIHLPSNRGPYASDAEFREARMEYDGAIQLRADDFDSSDTETASSDSETERLGSETDKNSSETDDSDVKAENADSKAKKSVPSADSADSEIDSSDSDADSLDPDPYDLLLKPGEPFVPYFKSPHPCKSEEPIKHSFSLHHWSLCMANIFVDPENFEITGIIGWKTCRVSPSWDSADHPFIFMNDEPASEVEPPIPKYPAALEEEDDKEAETNGVNRKKMIDERDKWEDRLLRQHYDGAKAQYGLSNVEPEKRADDPALPSKAEEIWTRLLGWREDVLCCAEQWQGLWNILDMTQDRNIEVTLERAQTIFDIYNRERAGLASEFERIKDDFEASQPAKGADEARKEGGELGG